MCSDWQVHLSVSQVSVSLSVDCQHVGERPARPLGNLPTDGFEMLGKLVKTRGPNSGSAPVLVSLLIWHWSRQNPNQCSSCFLCFQFALQSFEIICNTTWASEDTCCDLPAVVSPSHLFNSGVYVLLALFGVQAKNQTEYHLVCRQP